MLSNLERTRLEKRNSAKLTAKEKKEKRYNDMIVRAKIKEWAGDIEDVLFVLETLPAKQIKKIVSDDHVFCLMDIVIDLLRHLKFAPIRKIKDEFYVLDQIYPKEGGPITLKGRAATDADIERSFQAYQHVQSVTSIMGVPYGIHKDAFEKADAAIFEFMYEDLLEARRQNIAVLDKNGHVTNEFKEFMGESKQ